MRIIFILALVTLFSCGRKENKNNHVVEQQGVEQIQDSNNLPNNNQTNDWYVNTSTDSSITEPPLEGTPIQVIVPTPTQSSTPEPTPTVTVTPNPTPVPTPTPNVTPTPTPAPKPTPKPRPTPKPGVTPKPSF